MSKHTPGPWKIIDGAEVNEPDVFRIIPADAYGDSRADGPIGDVFRATTCSDDAEANARLIAAAPELLEALERVCRSLGYYLDHAPRNLADGDYGASLAFSNAHNVIAKAKGEAQDERQD